MTHPIILLQGALVAALRADAALTGLIGPDKVFDAPPKGTQPPFLAIDRHDIAPRDGDMAPGNEHRVVVMAWHPDANRRAVAEIAERVLAVALSGGLSGPQLKVTLAGHQRTETSIDTRSGQARATVHLRFLSEA
ncbi:hypothetical protein VE25_07205 [Devosia geojensis]|uniref:Gene transfer agent protein n=1 Tax=Devosia geojensis TaxID=443610 RepID=A0A0F5FUA6_9HYPH|nr:DUF3168 domain-containing protein [Devosia geojensis]KKB12456.1 hypothetical protein VE25_07205 [Devosia geojensis]